MKAIQTTATAVGLFAFLTSSVAIGVLIAGRIGEVHQDIQRAQAMTRATCANVALQRSEQFDGVKAKCEELN